MGYTYPVKHPEGTLTTEQLHALLNNKQVIARRLADLTKMRFIADYLLPQRLDGTGGGVFYETGDDDAFAPDDPEAIAPLSEFPLVTLDDGEVASARTVKWGLDTMISDEKIARQGIGYLNKGLLRVSNTIIRHVDRVSMAVIASKVTSTFATGGWTSAGKAVASIMKIQAERGDLGTGLELDTVALRADQYANVIGMLIDDKALPREQGETAIAGNLPVNALGLTWVTSPHYTSTNPTLVDPENLGGMADEKLNSPGYAQSGGVGVETKVIRDEDTDGYKVRGRRVTVPVVLDALAGVQLTGTGI